MDDEGKDGKAAAAVEITPAGEQEASAGGLRAATRRRLGGTDIE